MQKGVMVSVQLLIEGDAPPAEDFSQTGRQVATQVLQQGLQHFQGPYTIQVKKIAPMEGGDDDADEPASGDAMAGQPLLSYTPSAQASAQPSGTTPAPAAPKAAPASGGAQPGAQHPAQPSQPSQPEPPEKHHFWDRG